MNSSVSSWFGALKWTLGYYRITGLSPLGRAIFMLIAQTVLVISVATIGLRITDLFTTDITVIGSVMAVWMIFGIMRTTMAGRKNCHEFFRELLLFGLGLLFTILTFREVDDSYLSLVVMIVSYAGFFSMALFEPNKDSDVLGNTLACNLCHITRAVVTCCLLVELAACSYGGVDLMFNL